VQRSSETIGNLAAALAKAQLELVNPEKSLAATIRSEGGNGAEQTFRYAPLSSGLEIVRKTLGQHEIATVQTTAVDQTSGIINLTTVLAHSSGEWIASDWPVCAITDAATPHRMGAALTYARRYALFTLVGIAGEDDLDAPDLTTPTNRTSGSEKPKATGNGPLNSGHSGSPRPGSDAKPTKPILEPEASAELRDRLLTELSGLGNSDAMAVWAHRVLGAKNCLTAADALQLQNAFAAKLATLESVAAIGDAPLVVGSAPQAALSRGRRPRRCVGTAPATGIDKSILARPEPRRVRDKNHVKFVAKQPCLICGRMPADAHHLRFAQHRALGRKPSDEFTVPLCRGHHREVHRSGDEAAWWTKAEVDPTGSARSLWLRTHPLPAAATATELTAASPVAATDGHPSSGEPDQSIGRRSPRCKRKPIVAAGPQ